MAKKLVECVPNFSEGRRRDVIDRIVKAMADVPDIRILEVSSDADHNRTVVTFVGVLEAAGEAAFRAVRQAAELIKMEEHRGAHPRIGAADVIPFVPIAGVGSASSQMEDCVALARATGGRIAEELGIPVYLYGEAALKPERRDLSEVRRGQYEGLKQTIHLEERLPDFGPPRLHPTAGATAVGAREPLVAYNVVLSTPDVGVGREVARAVRASSGGFVGVKAIAVKLAERNVVQVSMNVLDPQRVPLARIHETIRSEAERFGARIVEAEIVGLVPMDVLIRSAAWYLRLHGFRREQILEHAVSEAFGCSIDGGHNGGRGKAPNGNR